VTGDDLIAMGLAPGPRFGEILDVLYDAQLNEELSNRDGALKRLREVVAQLPG
jgi:poly(A) polymerase